MLPRFTLNVFRETEHGQTGNYSNQARKHSGHRILLYNTEESPDHYGENGSSEIRPEGPEARDFQRNKDQVDGFEPFPASETKPLLSKKSSDQIVR